MFKGSSSFWYSASALLCVGLSGCGSSEQAPVQEKPALRLVNVLEKEDFNNARIAGSIHIPYDQVDTYIARWEKDVPVIFYCSNYFCGASGDAAQRFAAAGFSDVSAYEGGTAEWYQLRKNDPSYAMEGSLDLTVSPYLEIIVPQPNHQTSRAYRIITAQELINRLKDAKIL